MFQILFHNLTTENSGLINGENNESSEAPVGKKLMEEDQRVSTRKMDVGHNKEQSYKFISYIVVDKSYKHKRFNGVE